MDTTSIVVAAVCGVLGSLLGQWMLGVFGTEPKEPRPMPLGPPPALRAKRPTVSDIMSHIEQACDVEEYESRYAQMEGPSDLYASFTFENADSRSFRVVSRDSFATLGMVTIYEMVRLWEAK